MRVLFLYKDMVDVIGYKGYRVDEKGVFYGKRTETLKQRLCGAKKYQYLYVYLWQNGGGAWKRANRLVYLSHFPDTNPTLQINHKNGDRLDNRLENLEPVTASENCLHRSRNTRGLAYNR